MICTNQSISDLAFCFEGAISYFDLFTSSGEYWIKDHPPLHFIFLKFVLLFGRGDVFLRATSLLWFLPSLYLVYLIGRKFSNHLQTLLVMALFSSHPLLLNLSFQVRPYSLAIFLVLLSIYLFVLQLKHPNSQQALWLGLFVSLSFWTSYASVWLIAGMGIFLVLQVVKHGFSFLLNFYHSLILFLSLSLFQLLNLFFALFDNFLSATVIAGSVPDFSWLRFVQELGLITGLRFEFLSLFVLIFLPIIFIRRHNKQFDYFMVILFIASILLSVLFSIFSSPIFLARQLFVASIALTFIIAKLASDARGIVFALLVLCVYVYFSFHAYGFLFQTNINDKVSKYVDNGDLLLIFENNYDYLNYYLLMNGKRADVAVIDAKQFYQKKLLSATEHKYHKVVFFTHYCPENQYNDCYQLVEELQDRFCKDINCVIAE